MYLKSIEIQGFKSFANKLVFEFHNGITGIVGPNGSGKSNVADAVRWVLGEQRVKQLRGGSMQDVIFAGTELRKAQGFAYVAITLDNSDGQLAIDYEQVTISRRLYRSGESEYRINGSTCRLKDVNELFYDTGIGKEGYSIIGQGQIDKILSGKPEERRELFDEAAGIVKFKRRKGIAQKKLEDEKQNLVRVKDILSELEKQVGPLERQAETARHYLQLKEELKIYDVNGFLIESFDIKEQLRELSGRESIVAGDLEDTKTQAETIRQDYDRLAEEIAELDKKLSQSRQLLNQENMKKGGYEGRINVLNEQINTERMNAEHLKNRREAIQGEVQERQKKLQEYDEEKKELSGKVDAVFERQKNAEITLMDADISIEELEQEIETSKGQIIETLNERAAVTAKQQRYETMLEQVNVRRSEISQKLLKIKSDESIQEELLKKEQEKLADISRQEEDCCRSQKELEEQALRMEGDVRRISRNLNEKHQQYQSAYSRLESLQNLAERYEGYGNSIRRVMDVRDRIHGIHGVVADLIATEKKYEIAIETALGGSIQNIVTDSEETAKQLIEYLKKNKYGRATFLPLTSMNKRGGFHQENALSEPGVLGLADQLVKTSSIYRGLIQHLLGRVVVVDQIDHGIALAKKFQYSLRIVTLDGELLSPGGSMTGGAFKNSSNLLGRKREIEELEQTCEKMLKASEGLEEELGNAETALSSLRQQIEQVKADKQELSLRQNTVTINISQAESRKAEIQESSVDLVREHGLLEEQARELKSSQEQLLETVSSLEGQNDSINRSIEELQASLEEKKRGREQFAKELSAVQIETAHYQQQVTFIQENVGRIHEEIRKLKEEMEGLCQGQENSDFAIEQKQQEIQQMKNAISQSEIQREFISGQIAQETCLKEEKGQEQKSLFDRREAVSQRISALDKDLFRLQNQKEKLDEKLEHQVNYMWSEYELTYSTAEKLKNPDLTSLPEIRKQSEALKASIKALGNVNVNAIEDYREIAQRYEFLKNQHDDLVEAEDVLIKIIEELDIGMRRQFQEQFEQIRKEFDKVFQELFGGGQGTLELMEDEDILEAGIQIISQPPGKKLQNMMQLSGGEKALTAIALLFAIQNLKPSPFCLLDEIEAALDDSNVDRFAGYLHKLTKNTQFIVITHRRGTMVASDRLYGITMQEKGVSALVSVSLIESDLEQ
ncbi:MAG: chromosome segregation protein SMC [Lachnospiraceae bacterium]|jgi:chromosome segregation protein|nr:chromosome segregation protein SMC [Lachnospiraceae bacterium]